MHEWKDGGLTGAKEASGLCCKMAGGGGGGVLEGANGKLFQDEDTAQIAGACGLQGWVSWVNRAVQATRE